LVKASYFTVKLGQFYPCILIEVHISAPTTEKSKTLYACMVRFVLCGHDGFGLNAWLHANTTSQYMYLEVSVCVCVYKSNGYHPGEGTSCCRNTLLRNGGGGSVELFVAFMYCHGWKLEKCSGQECVEEKKKCKYQQQ